MIQFADELLHRSIPVIPWDQPETRSFLHNYRLYPFLLSFMLLEIFYNYSINHVIIFMLLPEIVSIPLFFWVKNESLQVYFNS